MSVYYGAGVVWVGVGKFRGVLAPPRSVKSPTVSVEMTNSYVCIGITC
jgi:hypothetical protein